MAYPSIRDGRNDEDRGGTSCGSARCRNRTLAVVFFAGCSAVGVDLQPTDQVSNGICHSRDLLGCTFRFVSAELSLWVTTESSWLARPNDPSRSHALHHLADGGDQGGDTPLGRSARGQQTPSHLQPVQNPLALHLFWPGKPLMVLHPLEVGGDDAPGVRNTRSGTTAIPRSWSAASTAGMGLISGRKAFQRPRGEGIELLNSIQDVYLDPGTTVA